MNIETIHIKHYQVGCLRGQSENITHIKNLPYLSVVQSVEGSYDVALGNGKTYNTGQNGTFIAPSSVLQTLTHHNNPQSGVMYAHWLFLDVIINNIYRLDSLFDFPVLLPAEFCNTVYEVICSLRNSKGICSDLSEIYKLIDILFKISKPKNEIIPIKESAIHYINNHFSEKIDAKQLSNELGISVAGVFRLFKKHFGKTPSNYINDTRLSYASVLLANEDTSIGEIAEHVGFEDVFYFSKLFKKKYCISPSRYRKNPFL